MLKLTGVATSTAFVAGCGGGGGGNGGGGNGGGNGGGGGGGVEIDPGTQIDFSGQTSYWEGLAPSSIEGEQNPTLVLQEGEDYTIGWSEGDGSAHNMQIRDSNDEVIDELTTGQASADPGDGQFFDFTASSDMAVYRCQPHPQMEGEIQMGGGGGGGGNETGGNETGNETGGNETGNETGGNETGGNETGGNETGGNTTE
ncbi:cupredoxin domain-containing protein [Natrinema halophilum]|uniref:Blue (type 1) copper domain-containing protein n=1 Tax=Natrinema halophilum TaxID=1699371 RepID=A0A7D5KFG8_9EURY|nr:hypothetical protein [Natrinema halophilum]QLG51156.1 hypothetical protein HYG82_06225 [Natrinema halophilum]